MRAGDAALVQPDLVQERLHALFHERIEDRFQARHGQPVVGAPDPRAQLGEQVLLVGALLLLEDLGGRFGDLGGAVGAGVERKAVLDQPFALVGVKLLDDARPQLLGAPDQQAVVGGDGQQVVEHLRDVAQVVFDVLHHRALIAGLRPAARFLTPGHVVAEGDRLTQPGGAAAQDPRRALVDERHTHAAPVGALEQRRDEGLVGDDRPALERARDAHGLLERQRLAHEHGRRAGAVRQLRIVEQLAGPRQPLAQRRQRLVGMVALLDVTVGGVDQGVDLALARREGSRSGRDRGRGRCSACSPRARESPRAYG